MTTALPSYTTSRDVTLNKRFVIATPRGMVCSKDFPNLIYCEVDNRSEDQSTR